MAFVEPALAAVSQHGPMLLLIEGSRYVLGSLAVFLLVWVAFHKKLAARKINPPTPRKRQIRRELAYSAITVLVFVAIGIGVYAGAEHGVFKFYPNISDRGWAYYIFTIVFLAIVHDAFFYWAHRVMHHPKLFRHFHAVHHRSVNPTPFAAYSFNPTEAAVEFAILPLYVAFVPVHFSAIFIYMWLMLLRNAVGHCGYELMAKGWTRNPWLSWSTTVTHHHMHHEKMTGNYALYFTWWDRWMGTEHADYHERFDKAVGAATDKANAAAVPAE